MIILLIISIISIILLYLNISVKRQTDEKLNLALIGIQIVGIFGLVMHYTNTNSVNIYVASFASIFTIIIPTVVLMVEKGKGLIITEWLVLVASKIYLALGNRKKTKDIILKYLDKSPKSYVLHRKLGQIYEAEGSVRKAVKEYVEAVYINKKDYTTFFNIITLMRGLEKTKEAIELLRRLIKVRPDHAEAQLLLTDMLIDLGEMKEASKVIAEASKVNEEDFDIMYTGAYIHIMLSEFNKAKQYLLNALDINPISSGTILNLGQIELIEQEYESARIYLEGASEYRKVSDIALYELAKIDVLEEKIQDAIEKLNRALEINPEIIHKINQNILFNNIREEIVVKLELVEKEKVRLERKVVENINALESVLELSVMLTFNENKNKIKMAIDGIIRKQEENKTLEEKQDVFNRQRQFIEENINNADENI